MEATYVEQSFYGSDVDIVRRTDECDVYKIENDSIITSYHVFDGIDLVYNDVHTKYISVDMEPVKGFFEVNHCLQGSIEASFLNGEDIYVSKNEVAINLKDGKCKHSYFPSGNYYGISICINIEKAQKEVDRFFNDKSVSLKRISHLTAGNKSVVVMKNNRYIANLFSQLYYVRDEVRINVYKIKVMEILLLLSELDKCNKTNKSYMIRENTGKVKQIQQFITSNLQNKYTLNQLSESFDIPLTTMKKSFKQIFGKTIHGYVKEQRMHKASVLLITTNDSILEIANQVGYENGSKFASAFKDVIGMTPREYRNTNQ